MGAVSLEQGGRGKRRSLDATINVVPAIDLLSCCITFLLVTAVWTQIARLQVSQYGSGEPAARAGAVQVTLRLGPQGHVLQLSTGQDVPVPAAKGPDGAPVYDFAQLAAKLAELKRQFPDQAAITVAADDAVHYADLVHTIDACVGAGLGAVSVTGHAG